MSDAMSAQGTLVARQPGGTGEFTTIAELRNITPPGLRRNEIETTNQNSEWDSFVVGIKRRGTLDFQLGFVSDNATHDPDTGLIQSWDDGSLDGWRITLPDGFQIIFSGYLTSFDMDAPLDDGLVADVSVRPTGAMLFV